MNVEQNEGIKRSTRHHECHSRSRLKMQWPRNGSHNVREFKLACNRATLASSVLGE